MGGTAVAVAGLLLMYGPFLVAHVRNSANPLLFHDDVRQYVVPFLVRDYASEYYLTFLSIGYQALYRVGSVIADPVTISKVLPYVLLFIVLVGVAAAGGRIGGPAAAFSAAALCLSTNVFLDRMTGGIPRAFCFPFLACAAAALVYGRPLWLAMIVVVSAAFYPPTAVVTGLALALQMLILPVLGRHEFGRWTVGRRIVLVAATAVGTALVLAPGLTARNYGPRLTPADVTAYPEMGPGGRYYPGDRAPFDDFWPEVRKHTRQALTGAEAPRSLRLRALVYPWDDQLHLGLLALMALGLGRLAWQDTRVRRLLVLGVAAALAHWASRIADPLLYLAQRYVSFPVPILVVIGLPLAAGTLADLFPSLRGRKWARPLATLVVTAACLALLGGRGYDQSGLTVALSHEARLFEFLVGLPEKTLIAGWPGGVVDSVPYLSRRPALVTYETHQAFHRGYLDEMRRRMRALIDAMFAVDPTPLIRLRDEWDVTYLIVEKRHYGPDAPTYFRPFDAWIREALDRGRAAGFEVPRQLKAATVFSEGSLAVLDLRRLATARASTADSR